MATLNHIGIALSLDPKSLETLSRLFKLLDLNVGHTEAVPDQGVRTHFLQLPVDSQEPSHLELLETLNPEGPVAKFVQKRGPGIHHLSFLVKHGELTALCKKFREEGFRMIYDAPQAGAHGMLVNFIHPASAGGILIEVMEPRI